eukprot:ANDGO_04897.mRNA.1 AIG2 family protein
MTSGRSMSAADGIPGVPFFVYGTLRPDCPTLQPYRSTFLQHSVRQIRARLPHSQLYFESWPSLVFLPEQHTTPLLENSEKSSKAPSSSSVHGWLVYFPHELTREIHAFADETEDIDKGLYAKSLASAIVVAPQGDEDTDNTHQPVLCYVYHRTGILDCSKATPIAGGDWTSVAKVFSCGSISMDL